MKVSSAPVTSAISPTRNRARSSECDAMSPSAPEPAASFRGARRAGSRDRRSSPAGRCRESDGSSPSLPSSISCLRQHDRRRPPVVVAEHVDDAGLLHRRQHLLGFGDRVGQRFLAEHHLARLGRGDGDFGVAVARRADVDDVDVLPVDDLVPVGRGFFPAELIGRSPDGVGGAAAEDLHPRRMLGREEPADLTVRVAVRPSHECIANQRDIQRCHRRTMLVLTDGRGSAGRPTVGSAGTGVFGG